MMMKRVTFRVNGEHLLKQVKAILNEGNARKIIISSKDNKELVVIPLTVGVVGTVLVPTFTTIGMLASLIAECKITVEKEED
jgi:hypothetical protein